MNSQPIRRMVIVGRDVSLWLAAHALTKAASRAGWVVTVVELPTSLRADDVVAALPPIEAFHRLLGIDVHNVLASTAGTYSLGQKFAHWSGGAAPYFHGYGGSPPPFLGPTFLNFWLKGRAAGLKARLESFSLAAVAAAQGRLPIASSGSDGFETPPHGFHFDAGAYADYLKSKYLNSVTGRTRVEIYQGKLGEVRLDPNSGDIVTVCLNEGREISGDLFIDATGSQSALMSAVNVGFESWRSLFWGDRMLVASAPTLTRTPVHGQAAATTSGWVGLMPLQDRLGMISVYNSDLSTDEQALEMACIVTNQKTLGQATVNQLSVGMRRTSWAHNCVAIGEAAVTLDPIDNLGLHMDQLCLTHLIALLPGDSDMAIERREYTRRIAQAAERARDFQLAHYHLNRRHGQVVWDYSRNMSIPDSLAAKLDLFQARGRIARFEDEIFTEESWVSALTGAGLTPQSWDPLADQVPEETVIRYVQAMLAAIKSQVDAMISHEAYLELYCARDHAA